MQGIVWILFIVFIISRIMRNANKAARKARVLPNPPQERADFFDALDAPEKARDARWEAGQPDIFTPSGYEESAREERNIHNFSPPQAPDSLNAKKEDKRAEVAKPEGNDFHYSPEALRRAVVMAEILSPPKALRRMNK